MTFIAKWWFACVTACLRPFTKIREDRLKLLHTIELDKLSAQQRHVETILDAQQAMTQTLRDMMENNNSVIKEWLEGFHKLPTNMPISAPPVNDDERMWRKEMEALARSRGQSIASDMSSFDIEAFIRDGINSL